MCPIVCRLFEYLDVLFLCNCRYYIPLTPLPLVPSTQFLDGPFWVIPKKIYTPHKGNDNIPSPTLPTSTKYPSSTTPLLRHLGFNFPYSPWAFIVQFILD